MNVYDLDISQNYDAELDSCSAKPRWPKILGLKAPTIPVNLPQTDRT